MDFDDAVRALFKGSAILIVGTVFELGFSFIGKVLIARHLGRTDFGSVTIGIAFLSLTASIGVLGIDTGVARFIPRYDDYADRKKVISTSILLSVPLPLVLGIITFIWPTVVASALGASGSADVLQVFALGIPVFALVSVGLGITRGQQRSVPNVLVQNVTRPVVRLGGISVGVALGVSALGMAVAYVVPHFTAFVLIAIILRRYLAGISIEIDPQLGRKLLRFSIPLAFTAIMAKILADIDTLLLSYYRTTGEVGVYGVIYPLAKLTSIALTGAGFLFMPILSEFHSEDRDDDMKRMYQVGTKWIFMVSLPILLIFIFFPKISIAATFGQKYVGGSPALQILAIGFFLNGVFGLNSEALSSVGQTKFIALSVSSAAIFNIFLNIYLIPRYGVDGAAIATTISVLTNNALLSWRLYKTLGIQPFTSSMINPAIVALSIIFVIRFILVHLFEVTLFLAVIILMVFLLFYGITVLSLGGIREEEVLIINSIEERFEIELEPIKRVLRIFMRFNQ